MSSNYSSTNQANNTSSDQDEDFKKNQSSNWCFCCDQSYKRFVALLLIVLTAFFYSAVYDMPGCMASVIERTFMISPSKYEYMYSVYSFPNIVLSFVGGLLIDRYLGIQYGSIIFSFIGLVGQAVITLGGFIELYWIMLLGRFINGIGNETVSLCLSCFSAIWFQGKELSFVFGLYMATTRLGSSFAFLFYTPLYNHIQESMKNGLEYGISITPFLAMPAIMMISLSILGYFTRCNRKNVIQSNNDHSSINFKQILEFPVTFWFIIIMLSFGNTAFYGFISISQQLLQTKYGLSLDKANYISSSINLISAIASPFPGLIIDKIGKDIYFTFAILSVGVISQLIMALTNWNQWIPLSMFAVYFATFSCAFSLVARAVKPYQLGTAYGTLLCFLNLFLAIANIIVGLLIEKYGPEGAEWLFLAMLLAGCVFCVVIWILDRKAEGTLNLSSKERKAMNCI